MRLMDFATASDQDYRWLRQQIDDLPRSRAFLFENCELLPGCIPPQATVGFYKTSSSHYAMYLDGRVRYHGDDRAMIDLCKGPHLSFQSFDEMERFLHTLLFEGHGTHRPDTTENIAKLSPPQDTPPSMPDYKMIQRELEKHIIGQGPATLAIAHQVSLHLGKTDPQRPLSIVAYGPPGTGKSEAAKVLAKTLSRLGDHKYATVWTELNTFSEAHSVYRLIGSPPGYVGYDDTPVFEAVIHDPYTVFIFDELDKAHPEVLKTFMSILDEGRCAARKELPDHSREYDFRHCIFFFTSNFCLGGADTGKKIGFSYAEDIEDIRYESDGIEVRYHEEVPEDEAATVTRRIYRDTEAARRAFVEAGVLREIASRFSCFIEFRGLGTEAKGRILAKQVIAMGFEYGIKLAHISSPILQSLMEASGSEDALTVRSFRSIIEGHLAAAFTQAGVRYKGQAVQLDGTIETPVITPAYR